MASYHLAPRRCPWHGEGVPLLNSPPQSCILALKAIPLLAQARDLGAEASDLRALLVGHAALPFHASVVRAT